MTQSGLIMLFKWPCNFSIVAAWPWFNPTTLFTFTPGFVGVFATGAEMLAPLPARSTAQLASLRWDEGLSGGSVSRRDLRGLRAPLAALNSMNAKNARKMAGINVSRS
ncbi:hypothetical protein D3C85_1693320 [compost metagenome]